LFALVWRWQSREEGGLSLFGEKLPFVVNDVSTKTEIISTLNAAKKDEVRYRAMAAAAILPLTVK
jgi:hypothetical protein